MKITKESIRELIGNGKLSKALGQLDLLTKGIDRDLQNTVILQSARFRSLQRDEQMGIIPFDQATRTKNAITYALLSILDEIPDAMEILSKEAEEKETPSTPDNFLAAPGPALASKTILFVTANPKDSNQLRLGEEMSKISESLRLSANGNDFVVKQEWAAQVKGLRRAMLRHDPFLVHFSGHGSNDGGILLEDSEGYSQSIGLAALGSFFSLFKSSLKCVLLNSCYSKPQALEIAKFIPYVIGVSDKIPDETSIAFSEAFYDALGAGKPIREAFLFASNNISMSGLDGENLPVLLAQ